ncbi:MAG: methyltransferase domain-containing protein [Anaerolineales bacterium]|nr:methyltransferase domain-containing protein [Chloroflexota bacterium]MBL6980381.1 methyltransferase domain-containing protein [Anaerolineales bacterium]
MNKQLRYVSEPEDKEQFTEQYNRFYTSFAKIYDGVVRVLPFWKRWLKATLPHIQGSRVLEVSFGTGYLLMQYASQFDTYGIDYNARFVTMLQDKLAKADLSAKIQQGNVESLPYEDEYFDSIINTMAFTAYPDGEKAMSEMHRVLKPGGKIVMVDVDYPFDHNRIGVLITRAWIAGGDIVRDMEPLFTKFGFEFTNEEIGGFGSVHLYVAKKP